MEAIVYNNNSISISYDSEKQIPNLLRSNDVLVNVKYSGISNTDLLIIEGDWECNDVRPFVLGQEFCGVIESVGPTARFRKGQRVAVDPYSGCGICNFCRNGHYHHCESEDINTLGLFQDGGWAQYCRVPDTQIFVLPDEVLFKQAVLCKPLSCIIHGWDRAGEIAIGADILIISADITGNLWSLYLHIRGHKNVTVFDYNSKRIEMSRNTGLSYEYCTSNHVKVLDKTFDVIIDCTGYSKTLEDGIVLLKKFGKYIVFGHENPVDCTMLNMYDVFKKELAIIGVNKNPFSFPQAIEILKSMGHKYINYERLGIKEFNLNEYPTAIHEMNTGLIQKGIFKL